ncbi:hypothetical protein RUM43_005926 [Polyplax serrata]|uniref:Uncharacterized protein n=1 Tax=Polyplax serrata TaxID=468196 RepID=A0AAN8NWY1_POLSC
MGINWTAEIISWAIGGSDLIWLVTDMFNTLQGVTIFYIFVYRRANVWNYIKRQLGKFWRKLVTCNCRYTEESKSVTRIRRTNGNETVETCFTPENTDFNDTSVSV